MTAESLSVEQFFERMYRPRRLPGAAANTLRLYGVVFKHFATFLTRVPMLTDLTGDTIAGFLSWFAESHAPRSVNAMRDRLMALARYATSKRMLDEVPDVLPWPEAKRIPRAYNLDQMNRLLGACRHVRGWVCGVPAGSYWPALALTFYYTGLRSSAVWLVKRVDVDLAAGLLTVPPENHKPNEEQAFLLPPDCVEAIQAIWQPERELLFPWDHSPCRRYAHWRKILREAGLPVGRLDMFQRLRRTSGTLIEANGGDGSKHLHNSRAIFEARYLDVRIANRSQVSLLPRPAAPAERQRLLPGF